MPPSSKKRHFWHPKQRGYNSILKVQSQFSAKPCKPISNTTFPTTLPLFSLVTKPLYPSPTPQFFNPIHLLFYLNPPSFSQLSPRSVLISLSSNLIPLRSISSFLITPQITPLFSSFSINLPTNYSSNHPQTNSQIIPPLPKKINFSNFPAQNPKNPVTI